MVDHVANFQKRLAEIDAGIAAKAAARGRDIPDGDLPPEGKKKRKKLTELTAAQAARVAKQMNENGLTEEQAIDLIEMAEEPKATATEPPRAAKALDVPNELLAEIAIVIKSRHALSDAAVAKAMESGGGALMVKTATDHYHGSRAQGFDNAKAIKLAMIASIKSLPLPVSADLSKALERDPRCLDNLTNTIRKRFDLNFADGHDLAIRIAV